MLIQHSILYIVARLVAGAFSILTTALLTDIMDPAQYGVYGLALVIMAFASNIAFDWLVIAFTRFGQNPQGRSKAISTIVYIFGLTVFLTGSAALLIVATGQISPYTGPFLIGVVLAWSLAWF